MSAVLVNALAAFRSGLRSQSGRGILLLAITIYGLAFALSTFSARAPHTLAIDLAVSFTRAAVPLLTLIWAQQLFAKDIERKSTLWVLAYPSARWQYLLGRTLAIAGLGLLALGACYVATWLVAHTAIRQGYVQSTPIQTGWPLTATFLLMIPDLVFVASVGTLLSVWSSGSTLPLLGGIAFVMASRTVGEAVRFMSESHTAQIQLGADYAKLLQQGQLLLPDLARLDIRSYALYNVAPDVSILVIATCSTMIYSIILLSLASYSLNRRDFS